MDRRAHAAELRQLKRELPERPWLFARVAELLLQTGREREALALLRKGAREREGYASGLLVLAEALVRAGAEGEAELVRERLCAAAVGAPPAAWLQRLRASREDSVRHLELLRQAWELDQFSHPLNIELEQSGLRRTLDYEQALRPTAAEAARREEQFRRLMDQHAARREAAGPQADEAEPGLSDRVDGITKTVSDEESDTSSDTVLPSLSTLPDAGSLQDEDDDDSEGGESPSPPQSAVRDQDLSEQAGRLESLTRPLNLPHGLPEDPSRKVAARAGDLFDPRSMFTRRLAAIYLTQGYPALAIRTLDALLLREPAAADLPGLLARAREQEHRLVEQQASARKGPRRSPARPD